MRILVAEDERVSRLLVQRLIEPLGHEVRTAADGDEAWSVWCASPVDVVISDWMMPGIDGLELCRRIRTQDRPATPYTYFVMLTGMSDRAHFLRAIREGADDYLTKPVDRLELQVRLNSAERVVSLYRRLAEQNRELEEVGEERLSFISAVAESLGEGVCAMNRVGETVFLNPAAERMLGRREEEVQGLPLRDLLGCDLPSMAQIEAAGQIKVLHTAIRRSDGHTFPASVVMSVIRTPRGNTGAVLALSDITEQKRIADERTAVLQRERMARQETERALRIREEFLSVSSHELKTPLTALQLQVQNLQRVIRRTDSIPAEELSPALTVVDRQIARLTNVTNDLLEVSLHVATPFEAPAQPIDLTALTRGAVGAVRRSAQAAAPIILLDSPRVVGWWDAGRVERAVTNLLQNALKYGEGQPVEVRVEQDAETARVVVRDRGCGIPAERLEQIFERFDRGGTTLNSAGLGLGLYVAMQMAKAHGGGIQVESAPGEGSTFTLTLPLRSKPA